MVVLGAVGQQGVPEIDGRLVDPEDWDDPYPIYRDLRATTPIAVAPVVGRADLPALGRLRADPARPVVQREHRPPADGGRRGRLRPQPADPALHGPARPHPPARARQPGLHAPHHRAAPPPRRRAGAARCSTTLDPAGFDLVEALAYPLPVTVICELLGVPVADRHLFGPWSSALLAAPRRRHRRVRHERRAGGRPLPDLLPQRPVRGAPHGRRRTTSSRALLAVEEEGDRLTEEELQSIVLLLFVAGHETTMNLIGNGTVALLRERVAVGPALRRPGPGPRRGRGDAALRRTRPRDRSAPPPQPAVVGGVAGRGGPDGDPAPRGGQPRPGALHRSRPARHPPRPTSSTSPSATASTTASAPRWPASRARRRSTRWPQRFPGLELTEEPVHRDHFVLRGYSAVRLRADISPDGPIGIGHDRGVSDVPPGLEDLRLYDTRTRSVRPFAPARAAGRRHLHLRPHGLRPAAPRQHAQPARPRPAAPGARRRGLRRHLRHEHHRRRPPRVRRRRGRRQDREGRRRRRARRRRRSPPTGRSSGPPTAPASAASSPTCSPRRPRTSPSRSR